MGIRRGVLDEHELVAVRRAAAIVHAVGGLSLTLRSGVSVLARVNPWVHPSRDDRWRQLSAGAFRNAVAKAWTDHRAGEQVSVDGLTGDGLEVDWDVRPPGASLGFGAVRAWCGGRMVWVLASVLEPERLGSVLDGADGATDITPPAIAGLEANMIHDERLAISVVHIESDPLDLASTAILDEVLLRLVAATTTAELLASLSLV